MYGLQPFNLWRFKDGGGGVRIMEKKKKAKKLSWTKNVPAKDYIKNFTDTRKYFFYLAP